jgi:hypothetical protein
MNSSKKIERYFALVARFDGFGSTSANDDQKSPVPFPAEAI